MRTTIALMGILAGCSGDGKDTSATPSEFHPTLQFLAPADGSTVPAGDVQVSIVVDEFILAPPEAEAMALPILPLALVSSAWAHNETGTPKGYCALTLDDAAVGNMADTQLTIPAVTAGPHVLSGELFFEDGDELETPVSAQVSFTAQ